jgi:two-component system, sensor histidine kinase PdtaS
MRKKLIISIFFLFVSTPSICIGQIVDFNRVPIYLPVFDQTDNFDTSYLTVLEKTFYQAKDDTLRLALINDLAYYWHTRNLEKALRFTYQGLAVASQLKNERWEGKLKITQGAILLRAEKLDSAFLVLEQAKNLVWKKDLPLLNTELGYVMERRGLLSKATDYALESLKLGEELNDQKAIALAYSDLSGLLWKQSKFEQGLEYGLRAEKAFILRGVKDMDYSFTFYVIGNNYLDLKDYNNALLYFQKAIALSEQYGFYNNLADAYISLIDLYALLKEYKKAEEASKSAIKYAKLLDNNFLHMRAWLSVAKVQNLTKRPDEAINSIKTCLKVATDKFGDKYYLQHAYKELGTAYATTGDFESAHTAFLKYDNLKDSVFTAEADRRMAKFQTEFEVAQKEATISTQRQSLQQQKSLQRLTYGVVCLLVFILVGLYWNFRNNKRISRKLEVLNSALANKNKQLDKRNAENELLLKEIHHRVKNNLEVVSSLLALQSAQIDDPDIQDAMLSSQNRVNSMGILHQKLYQSEELAFIEMKNYFVNLSENILDSYNAAERVTVDCSMNEIELDVDTAVPIGLIVNELLTNSLKYAFPKGQKGIVTLSLKDIGENRMQLRIADNGIGKPLNALPHGTGFGTQLVTLLTRQLDGTIQQEVNDGTIISIQFKKLKAA